jgi:hypothetical protein
LVASIVFAPLVRITETTGFYTRKMGRINDYRKYWLFEVNVFLVQLFSAKIRGDLAPQLGIPFQNSIIE